MDRNRFNRIGRPYVTLIPIGRQGIAFDRLELDLWADDYISCNGRVGRKQGERLLDAEDPRLVKRKGILHIDKWIEGRRVCQSTGSDKLAESERYLARLRECIRKTEVYGVRPTRTFEKTAAKLVKENQHKPSLNRDVSAC